MAYIKIFFVQKQGFNPANYLLLITYFVIFVCELTTRPTRIYLHFTERK